jgi:hypothetical protein
VKWIKKFPIKESKSLLKFTNKELIDILETINDILLEHRDDQEIKLSITNVNNSGYYTNISNDVTRSIIDSTHKYWSLISIEITFFQFYIEESMIETLERLNSEYLDLFYISYSHEIGRLNKIKSKEFKIKE